MHLFERFYPALTRRGEQLGGVARRTRETMLLCEAAGFDVIIVESVGVGQTEIALRSMTDFFMLLLLPGSGDELQGIKKGIVEMADLLAVNKADGDNRLRAEMARSDQASALHYLRPATPRLEDRNDSLLWARRAGDSGNLADHRKSFTPTWPPVELLTGHAGRSIAGMVQRSG